ncbi:MAG: hypothetical protein MH252_00580 [Thermosynechococcaceae cyanobacterium MS004]|nr:hypothetical protein [Thermosynechococcaceae cyanobacterium MS004]
MLAARLTVGAIAFVRDAAIPWRLLWRSFLEGNSDDSITIWRGYNLVRHGWVGAPQDLEFSSVHKSGREGKYGVMRGRILRLNLRMALSDSL